VGVTNTLVAFLVYALALDLGAPYPVAATLGYVAGILNGYTWNRLWTFEARPFHLSEFSRYVAVQAGGLLVNLAGLTFLIEVLGLDKLIAEAVCLVPLVLLTYSLNRLWIFRPRQAAPR
jgi:putative flippase GtrA